MFAIITTNYDLLIEYALGSREFCYGESRLQGGSSEELHGAGAHPRRPGRVALTGEIPVFKLHGSISWDRERRYTDGRRGLTGNALIVAPGPEKTAPPELVRTWRLAAAFLEEAEQMVIFGFAFNPYDVALLKLLRDGGRNVRTVGLIDIAPPVERARSIWPRAAFAAQRPPTYGDTGWVVQPGDEPECEDQE